MAFVGNETEKVKHRCITSWFQESLLSCFDLQVKNAMKFVYLQSSAIP